MRLLKIAASAALIALVPLAGAGLAAPDKGDSSVNVNLFNEVFDNVRANYVEPVTNKQLVEGAIKGMLSSLDPHSSYMDAKEYREMMVQTRGEFGGLGMQVTLENGLVKIISPIDDTPASRAGLKPNDLILAIDDAPVTDMTLSDAVEKLRGAIGTQVKLTIRREGVDAFEVKLTRADIKVEPVKSHMEGSDIGYVRITNFSERTGNALEAAIKSLRSQAGDKLAGIVLDLRNNPGGLLDQAVTVSNDFLDNGEIVSIRGRRSQDNRRFEAQPNRDLVRGLPIVVLINGGSASASEIVAGALQDHHRAVLLGTRSFGKGSVQTVLPVKESGGAIRLTTALYYTPSGRSIQATGIQPDVMVEPAKVEKVAQAARRREADLRGALKNTDAEALEKGKLPPGATPVPGPTSSKPANDNSAAAEKSSNLPPGATPVAKSDNILDPNLMGTDADYQLVRAVDLLRGVTLFKKLAQQ
ncbi:MAG TPA: S41 family peptidase [Stellaceae bacterium]|nr:S41 family peptidase [Stellaceae bacterium]